ncbi:MAG: ABC transporter ATP-binding protein/permease [Prevotella sp.]|nr:ABC transporter ATP-binding protein/permease [Prevotella sp.]
MKIREIFKRKESKYSIGQISKWLWRAWRGNQLQAILNATLGLLGVGVTLSQVWAVQHAIDVASHTIEGSLPWAVALMGLLILCNFAISISSIWVKNILGIKAQNRMQQRMLDRILRSQWNGREKMHSGDVINRLEKDVGNVITFLTETIPSTISTLGLFIGAFVYLFSMDKTLPLIVVGLLPIFIFLSKFYMRRMRTLTRQVRDSDSRVQSVLQETIQNRMLIKTMESDSAMVDRLENTQSELRQNVVKRTAFSVFSNLILNFGFALVYLIAFLWSATRMYHNTLTFGGMTAFLQLVNRIEGPARGLTKLVPAFVAVLTAAERLMELEENPLEEQGDPIEMDNPCGIKLEDVCYAYEDTMSENGNENANKTTSAKVIDHLSFDFPPGTCTAILGETGAGKTTLVRIILALLSPQSGRALIYNNKNTREISPRLRCNFVYVPQGNTLMSGSIRDNLRLGSLTATDDDMKEVLHMACADFVNDLPLGLDTPCSEQGGGLSEGQAQRIAIARALLRNRAIMLFDEATSALDPETERQLLHNILANHDRTVIFITHRPAVVDYCDQTLHIEKI